MKNAIAIVLSAILCAGLVSGCQSSAPAAPSQTPTSQTSDAAAPANGLDPNIKATLTFATWDNEAMLLYDELGLEEMFQKHYPNVKIEIEETKDDDEYFNSMKIRAAANELPDVMFLQPRYFPIFKEYMLNLSDLEAAKNNLLAEGYKVDGNIIGIPEKLAGDYVFYWEDVFQGAGVAVPKTWDEFVAAADTLQQHYGQADPDFMAIAMGAKDEWPLYPLMEYGPASFSGIGNYWDTMTEQDEPFAQGTSIRKTYEKIQALFDKGVLGKDPLGIGYDQALALFLQKKGAMMADNSMGLAKIKNSGVDLSSLKSFYLPFTGEDGSFNHVVQGDFFMAVPSTSKNAELAKAFVEFYYSEWYPDYINRLSSESTMANVSKQKDPFMAFADVEQPKLNLITYIAGGDTLTAITSETKFHYNKVGTSMLVEGFDLESYCNQLNESWKQAREKLSLK